MKYCEAYAALLDPYIDGELSQEDAALVRTHLLDCAGCRAYVEAALAIRESFPIPEDAAVPDGFAEGVMAVIRANAAPRKKRRAPWAKVLLPLAACCAVVVLVQGLPRQNGLNAVSANQAAETNDAPSSRSSLGDLACSIDGCGDSAVDPSASDTEEDLSPSAANSAPQATEDAVETQNGNAAPFSLAPTADSPSEPPLPPSGSQNGQEPQASGKSDAPAIAPTLTTPQDVGTVPESAQAALVSYFIVIRLPADFSSLLPEDLIPVPGEGGTLQYELTGEEYDALAAALEKSGKAPEVLLSAPENRSDPASRALVSVYEG